MKIRIGLALLALIPAVAGAQDAALQPPPAPKSDFTNMMESLSNMLSSTNPKTAAETNGYNTAAPAAGEPQSPNQARINNLPRLVQAPTDEIPPPPVADSVPIPQLPPQSAQVVPIDNPKLSPGTRKMIRSGPSGLGEAPKSARGLISVQRGDFDPESPKEMPSIVQPEPVEKKTKPKFDIKVENARSSDSPEGQAESGVKAMKSGQYEVAVSMYKSVLKRQPKNRDALFGLAVAYHKMGERKQAREAYAKLLAEYPKYEDGLNNMLVFASEEAPQDALAELNEFAKRNPNFAPIFVQKATIYERMGDGENARKSLMKAVALAPDNTVYKYNLAVLLDAMGDIPGATRLYQQVLNATAKGAPLPVQRSQILERMEFIAGKHNDS